ncbi:MAG: hypothetical protein ACR2PS_11095 [Pseudomonadales bacterium]
MADGTIYKHFRCQNADGSSKDWAIGLTGDGLRIRYCATNQTARLTDISSSKFPGKAPDAEMWRRISQKTSGGYVEVGEARIERGRLVETKPDNEQHLFWEAVTHFHGPALIEKLVAVVQCLSECSLDAAVSLVEEEDGDGLRVIQPQGTWDFGFQAGGGLDHTMRGGGKVSHRLGPVPVLILLALDRAFPNTLRFTNDEGDDVKPVISKDDQFIGRAVMAAPDQLTAIGASLGLCLGPIRLSDTLQGLQDRSLWF